MAVEGERPREPGARERTDEPTGEDGELQLEASPDRTGYARSRTTTGICRSVLVWYSS